jgi:Flp pilus assembly protein TadG
MSRTRRSRRRSGALSVETAVVLTVFLLFLFGILEYCRFTFVRQVVQNAAREGARYAVVNTYDTNLDADTKAVVTARMSGQDQKVKNFAIQVYQADAAGNSLGPGTAVNTPFGQRIGVQIDCDYSPILPSFVFLNNTIHISARSLMCSEAN